MGVRSAFPRDGGGYAYDASPSSASATFRLVSATGCCCQAIAARGVRPRHASIDALCRVEFAERTVCSRFPGAGRITRTKITRAVSSVLERRSRSSSLRGPTALVIDAIISAERLLQRSSRAPYRSTTRHRKPQGFDGKRSPGRRRATCARVDGAQLPARSSPSGNCCTRAPIEFAQVGGRTYRCDPNLGPCRYSDHGQLKILLVCRSPRRPDEHSAQLSARQHDRRFRSAVLRDNYEQTQVLSPAPLAPRRAGHARFLAS